MFDFTTTTFVHDADMIEAFPGSATGQTSKALRIENGVLASGSISTYTGKFLKKYLR